MTDWIVEIESDMWAHIVNVRANSAAEAKQKAIALLDIKDLEGVDNIRIYVY
jgi:hypothetical protein